MNALLNMRLDKSSDDFIQILKITQNDLSNKDTTKLVKIYRDLVDVLDSEPTPYSDRQMRVITAIKDLGSDIWITLTARNYNVSHMVDCVADLQPLRDDVMQYISNSQDVEAMLKYIGLNYVPNDIGSLFITEAGEIVHMFSIFETYVAYLSEGIQPLVINSKPTDNVEFYKEEENEQ